MHFLMIFEMPKLWLKENPWPSWLLISPFFKNLDWQKFCIFRAVWFFWGWHFSTVKILSTIFWIWLRTSRPPLKTPSLHHFYEFENLIAVLRFFWALLVKWDNRSVIAVKITEYLYKLYVSWINQHTHLGIFVFGEICNFLGISKPVTRYMKKRLLIWMKKCC